MREKEKIGFSLSESFRGIVDLTAKVRDGLLLLEKTEINELLLILNQLKPFESRTSILVPSGLRKIIENWLSKGFKQSEILNLAIAISEKNLKENTSYKENKDEANGSGKSKLDKLTRNCPDCGSSSLNPIIIKASAPINLPDPNDSFCWVNFKCSVCQTSKSNWLDWIKKCEPNYYYLLKLSALNEKIPTTEFAKTFIYENYTINKNKLTNEEIKWEKLFNQLNEIEKQRNELRKNNIFDFSELQEKDYSEFEKLDYPRLKFKNEKLLQNIITEKKSRYED